MDEIKEAVLVEFKETFGFKKTTEFFDEGGVLSRSRKGAFDFLTVFWGELMTKRVLCASFKLLERLRHGGLYEAHKEVKEADVPRFINALEDGAIGIGLVAGFGFNTSFDDINRVREEVFGILFAFEAIGITQDTNFGGVLLKELKITFGLRTEAIEFLDREVAGKEKARRIGLKFADTNAGFIGVVHRLGQKGVVNGGLIKGVKKTTRRTHNGGVAHGIHKIKFTRWLLHGG